jgi:hypothetical protein
VPSGAVPRYYVAVQPGPSDDRDLDDADEVNPVVVGDARTGKVSAGKLTRLQVTMRNESHGVMASTPGLIAF